jgi:hypothetical protein
VEARGAGGRDEEHEDEERSPLGRLVALAALIGAAVLVYMLLFGGEEYEVTAEFQNAGQVVSGNEVVVGGTPVGSVESVELGPDGQALVTFTVKDEYAPLRRGTTATIRSPSLSQIAGRQILADETNSARASRLASQRLLGTESTDEYVRRIRQVTPADVQRVAQAYLQPERAVMVIVTP